MNAVWLKRYIPAIMLMVAATVTSVLAAAGNTSAGYDIILLAGQSNMAGRGALSSPVDTDGKPDAAIKMWDPAHGIVTAVDPLIHQEPHGATRVGLGMSFAKAYLAHLRKTGFPNRKVLLVGAAWGGTGFISDVPGLHHRWVATDDPAIGGDLYRGAVHRAVAALARATSIEPTSAFKAILWHQGESDLPFNAASDYASRHSALMRALRAGIPGAVSAPIVVGEMTPCLWAACTASVNFGSAATRTAMLDYFHGIGMLGHASWVSSAGLSENLPHDRIHFDTPSQRELGRRYFARYLEAAADLAAPLVELRAYEGKIFNVGSTIDFDADPASVQRPARTSGNVAMRGTGHIVQDPDFGNVIKVDQSGARLTLDHAGAAMSGSYTKLAWIKLASTNFSNHIISANNQTQAHYLYVPQSGLLSAGHSASAHAVTVHVKETARMPLHTWRHVAVTYDAPSRTMRLFANGVEVASNAMVPPAPPAVGIIALDMSGFGSTVGSGLDGQMIGNRLYSRALLPAQIAALYNIERMTPGAYAGAR